MRALVLAAGLGTRLRPLTNRVAKPTVPFFGRPLIVHTLSWLEAAGVEHAVINLFHAPDSVRAAVRGYSGAVAVTFIEETTLLGTGGALVNARSHLGEGPVLVVNGDALIDAPSEAPSRLASVLAEGAMAALWLSNAASVESIANVEVAPSGRLIRIAGRPGAGEPGAVRAAYLGIQVVAPSFIELVAGRIGSGFGCLRDDGWIPALAAGHPLTGVPLAGAASDLGTPERYLDAHLSVAADCWGAWARHPERRPGVFAADPLPDALRTVPPVVIGPTLTCQGRASLGPNVVMGSDVTVVAESALADAVVWDGERVEGVRSGVVVGAGTVVRAR